MNRRHRGFSLIEIMVGLLMGMLAVIVVMQVFELSESNKRTTTGGADAATNGATALYVIERDSKMAGWGLDESLYLGRAAAGEMAPALPGCVTTNSYCSGDASCGGVKGPLTNLSYASVAITDGAAGGPDVVTMRFFSNPNISAYVPPTSANVFAEGPNGSGVPTLTVRSNFGCSKGDLILVSDPTQPTAAACTLMQVSATPPVPAATATSTTIPHQSSLVAGVYGAYNNPDWDIGTPGKPLTLTSSMLVTCFSHAADGPTFQRVYSINTAKGILERTDNTVSPTVTDTISSGIVDLQAQYGIAADGSQVVTEWTDASAAAGWANPAPAAATVGITTHGRLQNIKAVRIALLARSAQYEKPEAGTCNATTGSPGTHGSTGWSTWATFNTSKYPADWACYRYKAFEIVIPLRNVIWANI